MVAGWKLPLDCTCKVGVLTKHQLACRDHALVAGVLGALRVFFGVLAYFVNDLSDNSFIGTAHVLLFSLSELIHELLDDLQGLFSVNLGNPLVSWRLVVLFVGEVFGDHLISGCGDFGPIIETS